MFENELMQNKNLSYLAVSLGLKQYLFSRLPDTKYFCYQKMQ